MIISTAGRAFIENQEGCVLTAYWDEDGWSIGYGHHSFGVHEFMQITRDQADAFLSADLVWVNAAVNSLVRMPIAQSAFDALGDFVYNEGAGALQQSTLLFRINHGATPDAVTAAFEMWDKARDASGKLVDNAKLLARRKAEAALFFGSTSPA